eukprot:NODE_65_length_25825_cov_1.353844.p2 type:complete len:985 gc:universal NODE_65_length_25825_cov_1.353844:20937-23891(+)
MPTKKSKPIPNAIEKNKATVKKKVDIRIQHLLANAIQQHHRSFLVMVGEHGSDQIMHLHYFLTNHWIKRPSVLWCYKKDLGFSSNRKKRIKYLQQLAKKGLKDADTANPFDSFISTTDIRYCYYKETQNILGNTYGMLVLQDFEAITPNILARTMECIQGGGLIVLLLKSVDSLKQLHSLSMDVYARFKTDQFDSVIPRFNERFIMSLMECDNCLVVDDELSVLPISQGKHVSPPNINVTAMTSLRESVDTPDLKSLKEQMLEKPILHSIIVKAKTVDQAQAMIKMFDCISSGNLKSTFCLTAGRGRGKSAALGLSIAAAVAQGYTNIFVTSPSPENLRTLFEFVFTGFEALGFKEHADFDSAMDSKKCVTRINIFKNHRQTIQYIDPSDHAMLVQAELLVIDEAAAIPLTKVRNMLGSHMTFLSSTINGYEGTGRSLSLKLVQELKQKENSVIYEESLQEPIRYYANDAVEKWLNSLLCLNSQPGPSLQTYPPPQECELYFVNRDTLFSHHQVSEKFLSRMVGMFVSSHYKNQPNDLQLMSDAPAHRLFVLLPPNSSKSLPNPLVVIQICIEGAINNDLMQKRLQDGTRVDGDLIPHVMAQQYQDSNFASLKGARIVRIATHPSYQSMGYGQFAVQKLLEWFSNGNSVRVPNGMERGDLGYIEQEENVLKPLLVPLDKRVADQLDYIGVSYGLTSSLLKFWSKLNFRSVYLRQTMNEVTGEHTMIMLKSMQADSKVIDDFQAEFCHRFIVLQSFDFKELSLGLSMAIINNLKLKNKKMVNYENLYDHYLTSDIKRIKSFCSNLIDYHVLLDLLPKLAEHVILNQIQHENGSLTLSGVQKSILLGLGLQRKKAYEIGKEMSIPTNQVLALLAKSVKKVFNCLETLMLQHEDMKMPGKSTFELQSMQAPAEQIPLAPELDADLEEELDEEVLKIQKESLQKLNLEHFNVEGKLNIEPNTNEPVLSVPVKNKRKNLQSKQNKKLKK